MELITFLTWTALSARGRDPSQNPTITQAIKVKRTADAKQIIRADSIRWHAPMRILCSR